MRGQPLGVRVFWSTVVVLGTLAVILVASLHQWGFDRGNLQMMLFMGIAAVAGGKKMTLFRPKQEDEDVSMSLGFAVTFAALLHFGPIGCILSSIVSGLSGSLYPKRQPWIQFVFNVALGGFEAFAASWVYMVTNGWTLQFTAERTIFAVCAATLTFFVMNTGGVATIIALSSGQSLTKLWRETFLWTAPSYFAGATVSALAVSIFGLKLGYIVLFVLPVAYLTWVSYATYTARASERQKHIEQLQENQSQLADLYLATIKTLALAIDAKDQYTHQHILRVQRYAVAIAEEVGMDGIELEAVNTGALLHDIGKLGVPEYVLLKPGRLTDEEFEKIKKHPEIGAAILDPVQFPWPVVPVVKYHHERWDGKGYPEGLSGTDIPYTARILSLADVYDALTSTRSYRGAWSHEQALNTIREGSGSQFDPDLVEPACRAITKVVEEMAVDGHGPLTSAHAAPEKLTSKAVQAAEDISRVSTEFWALYEVAQTLSASLGLTETVEILAKKLQAIFPGATCAFLELSEDEQSLEARAAVGPNSEYFKVSRTVKPDCLSLRSVLSARSFLGEYDSDDLYAEVEDPQNWAELKSSLIVPVVFKDQPIGTLNLYHQQESAFGHHEQHLLETIADRAAMALFNGVLYDRSRGHANTDPLTGLYNLRYLTQHVDLACGANEPFGLLCLDLDSFKP
ncbi:MAG: HD domain-containing protein, partial [Chthonomonadaceae bacterium]|nr:HD domain-containing protein [Chthonomonadaceae bacterium]